MKTKLFEFNISSKNTTYPNTTYPRLKPLSKNQYKATFQNTTKKENKKVPHKLCPDDQARSEPLS